MTVAIIIAAVVADAAAVLLAQIWVSLIHHPLSNFGDYPTIPYWGKKHPEGETEISQSRRHCHPKYQKHRSTGTDKQHHSSPDSQVFYEINWPSFIRVYPFIMIASLGAFGVFGLVATLLDTVSAQKDDLGTVLQSNNLTTYYNLIKARRKW